MNKDSRHLVARRTPRYQLMVGIVRTGMARQVDGLIRKAAGERSGEESAAGSG
ncbi:hypothetical protein PV779_52640 [Streptomyces sp. ID01-9D]|nr:hypothetical protein [Streptomyces sp. ID01-9D]